MIPPAVRAAIAEHARAELPNESCGLLLLEADVAIEYVPAENASPSPYFFELRLDPVVWADIGEQEVEQAVVHSHVSSPPRPSRTDVERIGLWDGQPYVIPTLHARVGDIVYVHGSAASRAIRSLTQGLQACLTVTLLDGLVPLHPFLLCVSGRLSFELVQKACVAGAPVLVGVGAPTSLAVRLADDRGLTLCGFARRGRVNVYTRADRVSP